MMEMSKNTGLLSLPNELLDRIVCYLAPSPEERAGDQWFWIDEDDRKTAAKRAAWKKDIRAIRLACKRIAGLWMTKAALFYDVTLYVSDKSLDNFRALSERDDLRCHVRCIIFMHPQATSRYENAEAFERLMRSTMRRSYEEAFHASALTEELHSRALPWNASHRVKMIEQLLDEHMNQPETKKSVFRARRLYSRVVDEERRLLKGDTYVSGAAHALSQCGNVESVVLCKGDGAGPAKSWSEHVADDSQPTWMQQNHPGIIERSDLFLDKLCPADKFQAAIFEVLGRTSVTVKHLMFSQTMCWHPSFDFEPFVRGAYTLKWSHLQDLKLVIYDDYGFDMWRNGMDTSLLPFLASTLSTLRSLHLSSGPPLTTDPIEASQSSFALDRILELDFAHLRELHLCALNIDCRLLGSFISKRPAMCVFELVNCLGGDDQEWPFLFASLNRHQQLTELSLYENISTNFGDEFTVISRQNLDIGVDALFDYLHRRGAWTNELEEMFGPLPS